MIAATASFADVLHQNGHATLRIDDIDPPRIVTGSAERIVQALHAFEFPLSGTPLFQSTRTGAYQKALQQLVERDVVFACSCSRPALHDGHTCTSGCVNNRLHPKDPIQEQLKALNGICAIRLNTAHKAVQQLAPFKVADRIQGNQCIEQLCDLGTPVLWRKDGHVSYLLATSIDDSAEVTDVVRGADLCQGSSTQQLLMELLERPVPTWAHVPCAVDEQLQKLGKQTRAPSIHDEPALPLLQKAWTFLGQTPIRCDTLEEFWAYAANSWTINSVPKVNSLRIT